MGWFWFRSTTPIFHAGVTKLDDERIMTACGLIREAIEIVDDVPDEQHAMICGPCVATMIELERSEHPSIRRRVES